jgi:transposase
MGKVVDQELERAPFEVVEIDEGYLPTGNKGLPRHFSFKRGRGSEKNSSILGIVERGGRVVLYVIPKTDSQSIVPIIQDLVPVGSTIYTDSWGAYNPLLSLGYKHEVVNHDIEFVKKSASTNAMENVFSNLGRMIGTYRNVSEYKLQQYLYEFAFRRCFGKEYDYGLERFLRAMPCITECYWDQKTKSAA